ncbi:hypothetical protein ACN38_g7818, partial [Penicillium nordicum]
MVRVLLRWLGSLGCGGGVWGAGRVAVGKFSPHTRWVRVRCQSARLHTWIYMVLYHGDHVTSST